MSREKYSWRYSYDVNENKQDEYVALKDLSIAVSKTESREFLILARVFVVTMMNGEDPHYSLKAILNKIKTRLGEVK